MGRGEGAGGQRSGGRHHLAATGPARPAPTVTGRPGARRRGRPAAERCRYPARRPPPVPDHHQRRGGPGVSPARRISSSGLSVAPPVGWEATIYRRTAAPGEVTFPVVHVATVPLVTGA